MGLDKAAITHMLQKLDITLQPNEDLLEGKALLKIIMCKLLPATDALLETVVLNLPSPIVAQRYRAEALYDGPMTDTAALSIKSCDPTGPLVIYVSKLAPVVFPPNEKGQFYALGRFFSGTVRRGDKIRVQGPKYDPGNRNDLFIKSIQSVVLMHGTFVEPLEDCSADCLVGISGVDQVLVRSGTLTDSEESHSIRAVHCSVAPVVQVAVEVKNLEHLPRLVEGMMQLSKSYSHVQTWISDAGQYIIAAGDEHQLETGVKYLQEEVDLALTKSAPIISYRETVTAESSIVAMSKSPNKKKRFFVTAMTLAPESITAIEDAPVGGTRGFAIRSNILASDNGWDADEARKIWCFGPDNTGSNVFVDSTKGVNYLNEIKDGIVPGFQWATAEGVCAEEPVRAVRFDLVDYMHFSEGPRFLRGNGQSIPTVRRICYAACLLATPAIQEPIYLVEIQCPESSLAGVLSYVVGRRGLVQSEEPRRGTPLFTVCAHIPVSESLGLVADIRSLSATATMTFDHWASMAGSPLDKGNSVQELVTAIRVRKGLKPEIPSIDLFLDKI